jgi:hypothetical protein
MESTGFVRQPIAGLRKRSRSLINIFWYLEIAYVQIGDSVHLNPPNHLTCQMIETCLLSGNDDVSC